ncbi:TPA: hypothetical protein PW772_002482, partial [Mannheimia haemolytica]|nr:hypothetical protein [Mannheimia haemolytica]
MTKTKHKHPLAEAFYQLGKDVGEINRRLVVVDEQSLKLQELKQTINEQTEQIKTLGTVVNKLIDALQQSQSLNVRSESAVAATENQDHLN